ncbi:MAG: hypothetical protein ACTSU4_15080 [Promethearchaeota archaeon]
MQFSFYQDGFKQYGIAVITPSLENQNIIDKIKFNDLVIGVT